MNILGLDIETAPNTAFVWGLFKENIPLDRLVESGRVMCFSAKWVGKPKVHFYSENRHGHKEMVKAAHAFLSEADAVLSYNGAKFDLPTLHKEFVKLGLPPPSPSASIDLYHVVKRRFRFASNKLAHVLKELGLSQKADHRGFITWIECMNGNRKAWREMEIYNKQDVLSLEELYNYILPWVDRHPNFGLYTDADDPVCTNCGSHDLQKRGTQYNRTMAYTRYQCKDCKTWMRTKKAIHSTQLSPIGA